MKMPSSGMLRLVPVVRTDVSKVRIASIFRVKRIGELGTKLEVINKNAIERMAENGILHSHLAESLKYYEIQFLR
jgi:hypothetical protein